MVFGLSISGRAAHSYPFGLSSNIPGQHLERLNLYFALVLRGHGRFPSFMEKGPSRLCETSEPTAAFILL